MKELVLIVALTGAPGAPPPHVPTSAPGKSDPTALLAGPPVGADAFGATNARFGGSDRGRRRDAVSARQWFEVLEQLELSARQQVQVRDIRREFQEKRRHHRARYGERIDELRRAIREADPPQAPQLKDELDRILGLGPPTQAYQLRIWFLLDDVQQDRMRSVLAELRRGKGKDRKDRKGARG